MSHPYLGSTSQDSYGSPRSIPGSARTGGSATPRDDRFNTPRMYTARSNSTDDTFTSPRTWSENGSEYGTPRQGQYPTPRGGPGSARGGPSPRIQPSPRQVRQQYTAQQGNGQPYNQDLHTQMGQGGGQSRDQAQYGLQPQLSQDNQGYNSGLTQQPGVGYFQNSFAQQQQHNGMLSQQVQQGQNVQASYSQQLQQQVQMQQGVGTYDQQQYMQYQHQFQNQHQHQHQHQHQQGYVQQQQPPPQQVHQYQINSHQQQYHYQQSPSPSIPLQQQPTVKALASHGQYPTLREQHLYDSQYKTFEGADGPLSRDVGDIKDGYNNHGSGSISPDTSADYGYNRNHPDLRGLDAKADAKRDDSESSIRYGRSGEYFKADVKGEKAGEGDELAYRNHLARQEQDHGELTLNEEYQLREHQKRQMDVHASRGTVTEAEVSLEQVYAAGMSDRDVDDIFSYARHGRVDEIERLLDKGIPVDVRDAYGNTLLTIACQNGNKRVAKCVLRRAANINSRNNKGNTPLHYCYSYGYGDTLGAYLISKGADVHSRNLTGKGIYDGI